MQIISKGKLVSILMLSTLRQETFPERKNNFIIICLIENNHFTHVLGKKKSRYRVEEDIFHTSF